MRCYHREHGKKKEKKCTKLRSHTDCCAREIYKVTLKGQNGSKTIMTWQRKKKDKTIVIESRSVVTAGVRGRVEGNSPEKGMRNILGR